MFLLRKPTDELVRQLLADQRDLPFTYPAVGATRTGVIPGLPVNHHRARLGEGEGTFARAVAALHGWAMYRLSWTRLCWPDAPLEPGAAVAVVVRHLGLWSVNPCRIVYLLEERGAIERAGFAIGTLPEHAERGEERFSVEWHRSDDSVWFELFACAGPNHWLTRVGYPGLRLLQHRFGKGAIRAMRSAVHSPPA
ncbi:MAG TPA: DUF1990 domain-containing protein [Longimicrobiaceae bacterium]|nr:DUF1990 domain-containing protein [Longimicrobiaceae bacterium]